MGRMPLLIANSSGLLGGLVTAPLTARALGPEDRGVYAGILTLGQLVAVICALGIPIGGRRLLLRKEVSEAALMRASMGVAVSGAVISGVLAVVVLLLLGKGDAATNVTVVIFVSASCVSVVRGIRGSILVVRGNYNQLAVFVILPALVNLFGVLVLSAAGILSLPLLVGLNSVALLCQVSRAPRNGGPQRDSSEGARSIVLRSSRGWPVSIIEAFVARSDQMVVFLGFGAYAAGLYAVPALGVQVAFSLAMTVNTYLVEGAKRDCLRRAWLRAVVGTSLLLALAWLIAIAVAPFLVSPVFGAEFRDATSFFPGAAFVSVAVVVAVFSCQTVGLTSLRHGICWIWLMVLIAGALLLSFFSPFHVVGTCVALSVWLVLPSLRIGWLATK